MKAKVGGAPQRREDTTGRKAGTAWPRDVMVSAASIVVDEQVSAYRVADELKIPYTTLLEWAKKYKAGGRAALEAAPGRGGKSTSGYPQGARGRLSRTEARPV